MTAKPAVGPDDFVLAAEGVSMGPIAVRLARKPGEIEAAQRLRYDIFYTEYGAKPLADMSEKGIDYDEYDQYADHLIVIDRRIDTVPERVVGTYRLIRNEHAAKVGRFYTQGEFNIDPVLALNMNMVEVGRSCVHPDYRTRSVLQLLWQGIAEYVSWHDISVLFGCASFHGTDVASHAEMLSYLYHHHRAPEEFQPMALPERRVDMNLIPKEALNPKEALHNLPPLIKGYLRIGGVVGDGAVIDTQFNTIDVCVMVKMKMVAERYRRHYQRKVTSGFPSDGDPSVGEVTATSEII